MVRHLGTRHADAAGGYWRGTKSGTSRSGRAQVTGRAAARAQDRGRRPSARGRRGSVVAVSSMWTSRMLARAATWRSCAARPPSLFLGWPSADSPSRSTSRAAARASSPAARGRRVAALSRAPARIRGLVAHHQRLVVGGLHAHDRGALGLGDAIVGALLGARPQLLGCLLGGGDDLGDAGRCGRDVVVSARRPSGRWLL